MVWCFLKNNMQKHKFNIFPEMQQEDYSRLKSDIQQYGYDNTQPITLYQNEILDGWNRQKVCDELNIKPNYKDFDGNDFDAINFVMRTNKRRNLTSSQWACIAVESDEIIEVLKEQTEKERREKQAKTQSLTKSSSAIPQLIVEQPNYTQNEVCSKLAKTFNTNRSYVSEAKKLKEIEPIKFQQIKSGEKTLTEISKEIKIENKQKDRDKLAEIGKNTKIDIDLRLGDFEEVFSDLKDGSVDCIITDPPYPYEFIESWSKLSRFAKRVLKPNGFCIAYSGQMYLPEVMQRMSENLDYYWTFAVYHEGQTQIINGINLICRWKPVLIFQNGKKKLENTFQDYFISEQREKTGHDWQQSKSGVAYLIEMFTKPMDLILDPFVGSGTTLIVAKEKHRLVKGAELNEATFNIAKSSL